MFAWLFQYDANLTELCTRLHNSMNLDLTRKIPGSTLIRGKRLHWVLILEYFCRPLWFSALSVFFSLRLQKFNVILHLLLVGTTYHIHGITQLPILFIQCIREEKVASFRFLGVAQE